jgi:DNA-binding XRE family transcriptional regulator
MPNHRLENYLKTYRKRAGLSQTEMAYLLGSRDGTCPARHEGFIRTPSLETALAYEAIYGTPVRELFAGVYVRAEREAMRRARVLRKRAIARGKRPLGKLKTLGELAPDEKSKIAA